MGRYNEAIDSPEYGSEVTTETQLVQIASGRVQWMNETVSEIKTS